MSETKPNPASQFDRQLLQQLLAERQTAGEIEDLLKDLRKALIEHALQGELTHHLGYEKHAAAGRNSGNSRNGTTPKTIRTDETNLTIQVPHDRQSTFTPQLIGKHQRRWGGVEETILSLYAHGMSTRDIQSFLHTKYAIEVSPEFISSVCESVSAGVREWRQRPLAAVWPMVYLDALFLKVRDEGKVVTKALYVAVGVNLRGHKELLGLWLGPQEGAKFWQQILTELKSRGGRDILILCLDGLKGLPEAIATVFPDATIQTCVVHLVRHSLSFVANKERKAVAADLKRIDQAVTEAEALQALERFQTLWDKQYPVIAKSWRANWSRVKPMFELPAAIRQAVYTTNVIKSLNFSLRKIT